MLSGQTGALLIGLGIASTLLSVFLAWRMQVIDRESYPFHLSMRLLRYYLYLGKEILLANIEVIRCIIMPSRINPAISSLPSAKHTDLGKVIYANSITLTPGTVTLELTSDKLSVHGLTQSGIDDLHRGNMAKAIPDDEELV